MSASGPMTASPARAVYAARPEPKSHGIWLEGFVLVQIATQLALSFSGIGQFRILARTAVFGGSLALMALLPGRGVRHPAAKAAVAVIGIAALALFHPTTNSLLSGGAQLAMYAAILSPLFWVNRLKIDAARLRRVLVILWIFHVASASVGIVQVLYPGALQGNLSAALAAKDPGYIDSLQMKTATGAMVFRPMGLTDVPGGASTAAFYAVLLGAGFFLDARSRIGRIACLAGMIAGTICLYLSQVRSVLVMLLVCLVGLLTLLFRRGEAGRVAMLVIVLFGIGILGLSAAIAVGGDAVTSRLETLVEDSPGEVYQKNRGRFLTQTITEYLPEYPLGAGLGRWGMMNEYFGDQNDPERGRIWVEIQWTGWLLDGGVPLILAYLAALALAFRTAWKIALERENDRLWLWAAILIAYNLGALAVTFNYPFFIGQGGLELWLLNAALFAAWQSRRRRVPLASR